MMSFAEFSETRRQIGPALAAQSTDGRTAVTETDNGQELPRIDSKDVVGSLAGILGPSPEERAAEEQKLQEHRRKMHGWTALFNGLRHLGNLYYATKGAPGQKLSDPHQQIEQQYQEERKRLADIHSADRNYYTNLWGLYRQVNDEQRRNTLADAQAQYYGTRDEMARQKAERDRYSYQKMSNGSVIMIDRDEGTATEISEADPTYVKWRESITTKNRQHGNAAMIRANKAGGGSSQAKGKGGKTNGKGEKIKVDW